MLLDATLRTILRETRTIAVIGAKDKPGQPVDMVGRYLIEAGYDVRPVHPVRRTVWGMQAYPAIGDVPVDVDIVNVFRAPEHCPTHAVEVLALPRLPRLSTGRSSATATATRLSLRSCTGRSRAIAFQPSWLDGRPPWGRPRGGFDLFSVTARTCRPPAT